MSGISQVARYWLNSLQRETCSSQVRKKTQQQPASRQVLHKVICIKADHWVIAKRYKSFVFIRLCIPEPRRFSAIELDWKGEAVAAEKHVGAVNGFG
ncbi:hypothetical protein TU74_15395 [Pseudomonas lundensis]|nr:hypothetical protein TU74_15395 [Pseudomonas lundensis]